MNTIKPFSSIWYGSPDFLKMKLDLLVKSRVLLFYAFIKHHAEEDEKKDHIHVYMVPDGRIDTDVIMNEIIEYDLINVLPIKLLPIKSSKFREWYLYSTHNITYLLSLGQNRKYTYSKDDIITNEPDYLLEEIHHMDMSKINKIDIVRRAAERGVDFAQLVSDGQIPIQLIGQYQKAYDIIRSHSIRTNRGIYSDHEGEEDNER